MLTQIGERHHKISFISKPYGETIRSRLAKVMESDEITVQLMLDRPTWKHGFIKCRLLHLDGRSVVQPDVLLADGLKKGFFAAKFFDPNQIAFFEDPSQNFCRFTMATCDGALLRVAFFRRELVKTCADGSVIYRCYFTSIDGPVHPKPSGVWRKRGTTFQIMLFHHTNSAGHAGITKSNEIWASSCNIQGNLWLKNVGYGYFTSLTRISSEEDLLEIAMSSSGLTGLIPTNAPLDSRYAHRIPVPQQTAAERSFVLDFWVDIELLAPNHLWLHRPMTKPAYYEIVLPLVHRVGVRPGANLRIDRKEVAVAQADRKAFNYVIVGDAGTQEGLQARFNEEEAVSLARVQTFGVGEEIISFWKNNANTDQFSGQIVELVQLSPTK